MGGRRSMACYCLCGQQISGKKIFLSRIVPFDLEALFFYPSIGYVFFVSGTGCQPLNSTLYYLQQEDEQ